MKAQHTIRDALADGILVSALRAKAGGAFSASLPTTSWNTEKLSERFFFCRMNLSDPFGIGVAGDRYQYIFLSRESLDRYLASLRKNRLESRHTIGVENECRKWLVGLMQDSPEKKPRIKVDFFGEAYERFGIARRAFDRAWGNAAAGTGATAWVKGGAPKRSETDD